jgi:hypothetical protein
MTERPIIFRAPMVRAILAGQKTQTRRLLNPQPIESIMDAEHWREFNEVVGVGILPPEAGGERQIGWTWRGTRYMPWPRSIRNMSPYGTRGERLWVRETWATDSALDTVKPSHLDSRETIEYQADGELRRSRPVGIFDRGKTRVSIFMPMWASRITLEIVDVRAERLQDISEEDARAEGVTVPDVPNPGAHIARNAYARIWEEINGAASWDANPFVWCISFRVVQP